MGVKQQFADVYARERATTLKVLKAFPADNGSFKPHERSSSAAQLAWTFVVENNIAKAALQGPLDLSAGFPPAQGTYAEILQAYEASGKDLLAVLDKTSDSRFSETITFFTAPKQMGPVPVGDFVWMILMDSIHHRGQMSVYIRMAGGKVPSIYGPTADEPWN